MPFFENYGNNFSFQYKSYPPANSLNRPHIHPHYELLLFITDTSYTVNVSGNTFTADRPSAIIFSPFSLHMANIASDAKVERFIFYFGERLINEHPSEFKAFEKYAERMFTYFTLSDLELVALRPVLDLLAKTSRSRDAITQRLLFLIVLNKLISYDDRSDAEAVSVSGTESMNDILKYISEHFHESLTAEKVASHFFISRSKLNKDFKKYTGVSFHQLIDELKLSKTLRLLESGSTDMKAIASAVGFESETYFFAFFKKMTGTSPKKYARDLKRKQA